MEQQAHLPEVSVMLSVAARIGTSSSSIKCAKEDEDAEDDYYDGPEDRPEIGDITACLQKQAQPSKYDYYAYN